MAHTMTLRQVTVTGVSARQTLGQTKAQTRAQTLTQTLTLPLHRHRSPLTAHLSPFTLTAHRSPLTSHPHPHPHPNQAARWATQLETKRRAAQERDATPLPPPASAPRRDTTRHTPHANAPVYSHAHAHAHAGERCGAAAAWRYLVITPTRSATLRCRRCRPWRWSSMRCRRPIVSGLVGDTY